jgi:hypothetical protein
MRKSKQRIRGQRESGAAPAKRRRVDSVTLLKLGVCLPNSAPPSDTNMNRSITTTMHMVMSPILLQHTSCYLKNRLRGIIWQSTFQSSTLVHSQAFCH